MDHARFDDARERRRLLPALVHWGWFPLLWLAVGLALMLSSSPADAATVGAGDTVSDPTQCQDAGLATRVMPDATQTNHVGSFVCWNGYALDSGYVVAFASDASVIGSGHVGDWTTLYYDPAGAFLSFPVFATDAGTDAAQPSRQSFEQWEAANGPVPASSSTPSPSPTDSATPSPSPSDSGTPTPVPTDTATPVPTPTVTATTAPGEVTLSAEQYGPLLATALGSGCVGCFVLGIIAVRRLF